LRGVDALPLLGDWSTVAPAPSRGGPIRREEPIVRALVLLALLLVPVAAGAEIKLPPGFSAQTYVTGRGFDGGGSAPGIPSTGTLAFDPSGTLYAARTGRRYIGGGEVEDVWPVFRIPPGGARLTLDTEARYLYGPPLPNGQIGVAPGPRELLVTTYDRERKHGVLYRIVDGRAQLLAGGTPPPGAPPVLKQPEGVALDAAGHVYVADRQHGAVLRLAADGRVLDPRWLVLSRPRLLAARGDRLWIAADGEAEAPWQRGTGEIWTVGPEGRRLAFRGPIATGMDVSPGGHLFVADRQGARMLAVGPDGGTFDFATFTDGDAPRTVAWAPVSEATRRAGIAGDLFVAVIRRGTWALNEIVRVSGPFDDLVRSRLP
jgi:sugar lactone lactonase YvrE